jgi:hypothetical protein
MSVTLLKSGAIWHAFCEVHNQVDRGHFSAFPTYWFGVPWRREMICRDKWDCVDVFSKHIDRDCIHALSSPNATVKLQLTSFVAYAIIFVSAALLYLTKQPACQKLLSPSQIASGHHAPLSLSPHRVSSLTRALVITPFSSANANADCALHNEPQRIPFQ